MIEENDNKTLDLFADDSFANTVNTTYATTASNNYTNMGPIGATGISGAGYYNGDPLTLSLAAVNTYGYPNISISDQRYLNAPLYVDGDAEVTGDLKVKGVHLTERLDKIEERLVILHPNTALENKWEELRELGNKYRQLEANIKEKEQIWATLKK